MKTLLQRSTALAALLTLAACGGGSGGFGTGVTPTPAPTPTPTATPTPTGAPTPSPTATQSPTGFNVQNCLSQTIPGTGGLTVAQSVVPDTIKINTSVAAGFPNGRRPADAVIDITLAMLFLNINANDPNAQALGVLAAVPVNPSAAPHQYRSTFPYFGPAAGSPPPADTSGTTFNFRTDAPSAYVSVDRMGMPAVATALVGSPMKNPYNDADPARDSTAEFVPELRAQLTTLTNGLADDLTALGLRLCATRQ